MSDGILMDDATDAARYRWLRAHSWVTYGTIRFGPGCTQQLPERLDAAIDGAMRPTDGTVHQPWTTIENGQFVTLLPES
jgi:hypothetical protein